MYPYISFCFSPTILLSWRSFPLLNFVSVSSISDNFFPSLSFFTFPSTFHFCAVSRFPSTIFSSLLSPFILPLKYYSNLSVSPPFRPFPEDWRRVKTMTDLLEDGSTGGESWQGKAFEEPEHSCCEWYFAREYIESSSPSRQDGIDAAKEAYLRKSYCTFLQDLGMRLKVYASFLLKLLYSTVVERSFLFSFFLNLYILLWCRELSPFLSCLIVI